MSAESFTRMECLCAPPAPISVDPTGSQPWVADPADPSRRIPARVLLHVEPSPHEAIHVYQAGDWRYMTFGPVGPGRYYAQSDFDVCNPAAPAYNYSRAFVASLLANLRVNRVLLIGLGGGGVVRAAKTLLPHLQIDAVELDAGVIRVARRWFGIDELTGVTVHEDEGRAFLRRACAEGRQYDAILLDACDGDYIPAALMTRECLAEAHSLLTPGGLLCANVFATGLLKQRESATWAAVCGRFLEMPCGDTNRLLIAGRDTLMPLDELRWRAWMARSWLAEAGVDGAWVVAGLTEPKLDAHAVPLSDDEPADALQALRRAAKGLAAAEVAAGRCAAP